MPRPPQKQSQKSQRPKLASILLRVKTDKHIADVFTQRKKEMLEKTKKTLNNSLNFPCIFPTYDKWLLLLQYSHIEAQQNRLKELKNSEFPHIQILHLRTLRRSQKIY